MPALLAVGMLMPVCGCGAPSAQVPNHCSDVNLTGWQHPTRAVLEAAGIALARVQRCDDGKLDIFTVAMKYDPRTVTQDYYHALYARMAEANGWNDFVLMDKLDAVAIHARVDKVTHQVTVDYKDLH